MDWRVREITKAVRDYDRELYAQNTRDNRIDIYRRNRDGMHPPHFLFSLTDTWQPTGRPVDYGVEVVLNRLRAGDLWRDDTYVERWIVEHEKKKESKSRDFSNSVEAFMYDFRRQFARATNGINTSTLEKVPMKGRH